MTLNQARNDVVRGSFKRSTFELKRKSNPERAFAELYERGRALSRDGKGSRAARAAQLFKGGVLITGPDAARLAELVGRLEKQGMSASKFKVSEGYGNLGAGLALLYDAALERLGSSDDLFGSSRFDLRTSAAVARTVESVLPLIGSATVTALELSLDDANFARRLEERAGQLGKLLTPFIDNPSGPCEFCEIIEQDSEGIVIDRRCGTEAECDAFFWGVVVILLIAGAVALLQWIWDELFD